MTKKKIKYRLGEIELKDIVFVSDPIYYPGIWCQATIKGINNSKMASNNLNSGARIVSFK